MIPPALQIFAMRRDALISAKQSSCRTPYSQSGSSAPPVIAPRRNARGGTKKPWWRLSIFLPFVVLTAFRTLPAVSQTRPGFWEVSTRAAAEAGFDAADAPIILEHALVLAKEHDENGARPLLSRLQLVLAYVATGKYPIYTSRYGMESFNIDGLKYDAGLLDYLPTARTLQDANYGRWLHPHPDETEGGRFKALKFAAAKFAELEVAMRRDIATNNPLGLADALNNRGVVFRNQDQPKNAVHDYEEARGIYVAMRRGLTAMANADRAFSLSIAGAVPDPNASSSKADVDNFTLSADEQYNFSTIAKASVQDMDKAISEGKLAEASALLAAVEQADIAGSRINLYMTTVWPCHANNSPGHFLRAEIRDRKMQIEEKTHGHTPAAQQYFEQADLEYRIGLEIELFSNGPKAHLPGWAREYAQFLRDAGQADKSRAVEVAVTSLTMTDVGTGGPPAWRDALDCERLSR